jgi:uncharacterized protein YbcI
MKRVCAWCGRELDQPDRREDLQVTHGVCQVCRRRFFASRKAKEAYSESTREDVGDDSGRADASSVGNEANRLMKTSTVPRDVSPAWSLRLMTQDLSQRVGHRPCRPAVTHSDVSRVVPVKTQGEIEAAICKGMSRFQQGYMGCGPKDIRAHLIGDLLVVRLQGVLTVPEQHLVKSLPDEKGRDLLKQVRTHLIEAARPIMAAMILDVTGVKLLSLHHDISTVSGEEVVLFALAESPDYRRAKNQQS